MSQQLIDTLKKYSGSYASVTPFDLNKDHPFVFDFTSQNEELKQIDLNNEQAFNQYIFDQLKAHQTSVGIGKYNEDRLIYKRSDVFAGKKVRSIHLGIDIWAEAGTPVFAPLDAKIHSFKNNNAHGDYGPTIILTHNLDGIEFYTLYGHLSIQSIGNKLIGQEIKKGEEFGALGDYSVNVHWPPHLHFQIISDMEDNFGDFPGVAANSDKKKYLDLCPDPNLILEMKNLT